MDHYYIWIFVVIYRCKNITTCNDSVIPCSFILSAIRLAFVTMADCVSRYS